MKATRLVIVIYSLGVIRMVRMMYILGWPFVTSSIINDSVLDIGPARGIAPCLDILRVTMHEVNEKPQIEAFGS